MDAIKAKEFAAKSLSAAQDSMQRYIKDMLDSPMDVMKYGVVVESAVAKEEVWKKISSDLNDGLSVEYVCQTLLSHILAVTPYVTASNMRTIDLHILAEKAAAYSSLNSLGK